MGREEIQVLFEIRELLRILARRGDRPGQVSQPQQPGRQEGQRRDEPVVRPAITHEYANLPEVHARRDEEIQKEEEREQAEQRSKARWRLGYAGARFSRGLAGGLQLAANVKELYSAGKEVADTHGVTDWVSKKWERIRHRPPPPPPPPDDAGEPPIPPGPPPGYPPPAPWAPNPPGPPPPPPPEWSARTRLRHDPSGGTRLDLEPAAKDLGALEYFRDRGDVQAEADKPGRRRTEHDQPRDLPLGGQAAQPGRRLMDTELDLTGHDPVGTPAEQARAESMGEGTLEKQLLALSEIKDKLDALIDATREGAGRDDPTMHSTQMGSQAVPSTAGGHVGAADGGLPAADLTGVYQDVADTGVQTRRELTPMVTSRYKDND